MRQKRININDKEISYYESRDNGRPVIMVHGTSSSSSIFIRQLIDSVLSYQFRFIALDLIGHGNSENSDNPQVDYSLHGFSNFLVDFINELNIKDAVYVGHNFGGNIILEAFERLNNPKGIALLGSTPLSKPMSTEMFNARLLYEQISKVGLDDNEVNHIAGLFVEKETKFPDFILELIRKTDLKTRENLFESINKGEYKDQQELLKNTNIPIALYYGEFDQIINFDYLNTIEISNIWRNIIQIVKDVGHIFFYESPADFNISFEAFLNTAFYS